MLRHTFIGPAMPGCSDPQLSGVVETLRGLPTLAPWIRKLSVERTLQRAEAPAVVLVERSEVGVAAAAGNDDGNIDGFDFSDHARAPLGEIGRARTCCVRPENSCSRWSPSLKVSSPSAPAQINMKAVARKMTPEPAIGSDRCSPAASAANSA